jgi:hypothetical protein
MNDNKQNAQNPPSYNEINHNRKESEDSFDNNKDNKNDQASPQHNNQVKHSHQITDNNVNDINTNTGQNDNNNNNKEEQSVHSSNNANNNNPNNNNANNSNNQQQNEQSEKQSKLLLDKVFREAIKTGIIDKTMLPPSLCRIETMRLWREVLNSKPYKGIKKICLRWCAIQSGGAKLLADGLANSCMESLETLDLMGNEIGVSGTRAIASLLAPGVDLDSFQVQESKNLLAAFEGRTRIGCIRNLILSYNCTSDAGCGYLGKAICISNTLIKLELENCEIGDNGCKYLRRGIERNNTLKILNIAANRFTDLGAREIQSFLFRNNSLEKLDLSRNRLGAQRTMDIAKGLSVNHSLKKLRMNINRIGARGAQVLAKMLINNHSLEELELSYNEIFNDGVQVLAQGLVQNHALKRLVLWYNGLEDAAARQLARALHQRSKQAHFRNVMVQAIAESQSHLFFIVDNKSSSSNQTNNNNQSNANNQNNNNNNNQNANNNNPTQTSKLRPHPDTYPICEKIVDYVPIYMYFEVDLSHNRRITKNGINALLEVANSDTIAVKGLKDLLSKDRREREAAALAKTSLY